MKRLFQKEEPKDFQELGFQTTLECRGDGERAGQICGCNLYAYERRQQPQFTRLQSEIEQHKNHAAALHSHLYDRPKPVNDATMLTHLKKIRIFLAFAVLAAIACLAGNITTFYLFGSGTLLTLVLAVGATVLPLVAGHFAYEHIIEKHKNLQTGIIVIAVVLCFAGLYELADARRTMVDRKAAETPVTTLYVDGAVPAGNTADQDIHAGDNTENQVRKTLGGAMLLIMIAADLMLGFVVGLLSKMHTDEDYAAWRHLKEITDVIDRLEETAANLIASIEIAKRQCAAGILRAQVILSKRRIPYHRSLSGLVLFAVLSAAAAQAQDIDRYEGILIDTSGSISKNGATSELFQQYLISTKRLLATETPSTRVWVSSISVDSFGGDGAVVKGWTPESRGIFTDDLNRARRQLVSAFEQKSSGLTPMAAGTDIFGALWRFKALFESAGKPGTVPKTIWIFSDMINESRTFQMPLLLSIGPEQMMERSKVNGLLVPMNGYKIYIYGATPSGLSPQAWLTVKNFWTLYFQAAGAELVTYSTECEAQR